MQNFGNALTMKQCAGLEGPFFFDARKADAPRRLAVLLHGWGADGNDLIDLGAPLQQMMPDLALWCPHAPTPCSANPMGRQWFELNNLIDNNSAQERSVMATEIEMAMHALATQIGLSPDKLVLGGFSQGGMMSLQIATTSHAAAAGYASLSGALLTAELQRPVNPIPVFLAHGSADGVVPLSASQQAEALLTQSGYDAHLMTREGLGHGIDGDILQALGSFIHQVTSGT